MMKKTSLAVLVVGLALAGGGGYWWWSQRSAADAVQYRTAKIERGNLQATVSASGAVNPVTQVSVGTQVSGQIKDLYVDFNSEVKAGQLIARIDPETFEYRVRSAQADVDAASAAVVTAQAAAAASRARRQHATHGLFCTRAAEPPLPPRNTSAAAGASEVAAPLQRMPSPRCRRRE